VQVPLSGVSGRDVRLGDGGMDGRVVAYVIKTPLSL
jgi:hypothetical protein